MVASVLALALVLGMVSPLFSSGLHSESPTAPGGPVGVPTSRPPLSALAVRLQMEPQAVQRDAAGQVTTVFGLPAGEARVLLLPVNRTRGLPDGYQPSDLSWYGGRLVRTLIKPDLTAMVEAAARDNVELAAISAYRGPDEQALAYQSSVWRVLARERTPEGQPIGHAEAEVRAARFVAPPGHSQHQLGTAVDFSTWEVNYALNPAFAETEAGRWLEAHAWEYGFVLPYPRNGEERSGYAYEPWHWRWIGRELAAVLQRDSYLQHPSIVVDDYLRAAEELLAFEAVP
jgi:zinc D-Ala-D-Ala carboxypeptidase